MQRKTSSEMDSSSKEATARNWYHLEWEVLLWRENHPSGAYPPLKFPRLAAGITSGDYTNPNLVIKWK